MKALTLWQPWAFAITHLGKRIENRTWRPPASIIGERIAIHAGKTIDGDVWHRLRCDFPEQTDGVILPYGAIVATAKLVQVLVPSDPIDTSQGYWFTGPFGWLLDDVCILELPVFCKGVQGLWNIPEALDGLLRYGGGR